MAVTAILCIAVGAGASGALNMWYDADIDAIMTRTVQAPDSRRAVFSRAKRWSSAWCCQCFR